MVPFYMLNNLGQELDEMASRAMRLAIPASTRAIKQSMRLKLQEMPPKTAMKTPVGVFITMKVFTCLSNLSKIGIHHIT